MSLTLEQVSLSLGRRLLVKDISLTVLPGEVVGLLGPNGAGKTTTFNLLTGLLRPDCGQVLLNGKCINDYSMPIRARMGIGYLSQEPSVFRQLTVKQNLDMALSRSYLSPPSQYSRREELISDFNLAPFLNRFGCELSGGERRRCEIARALSVGRIGPRYLLLDEPFAGIDPLAVNELKILIKKLRKRGMAILITDHNVRETLSITERSYILNEGSILSTGPSHEVATDSLVRRHYLGEGFKL